MKRIMALMMALMMLGAAGARCEAADMPAGEPGADIVIEDAPEPTAAPVQEATFEDALDALPDSVIEDAPEPTATPAREVTFEDVLDALPDSVIEDARLVRSALAEGQVIGKGSKGDAARAAQRLLIALGQSIQADGAVGKKTLAALNAIQAELGLSLTEALDAEGLDRLLPALLDEEAASRLFGEGCPGETGWLYAGALARAGRYAAAKRAYALSGWGDWAERAAACVQPFPQSGRLWRDEALAGGGAALNVALTGAPGQALLAKVLNVTGQPVALLFARDGESAGVRLPEGDYAVRFALGADWFGLEDAFGDDAQYAAMTFGDSVETLTLNAGTAYTLTLNVPEIAEGATQVGMVEVGRGEF